MNRLVLDASVVVKWLVPDPEREADTQRAEQIFRGVERRQIKLVQPPHWLAEVAGVLARISPATVEEDVADLYDLELEVAESEAVYLAAVRLARELDHHLFDTLYHGVAIETPDAVLVTADDRYFRKARSSGRIVYLSAWRPEGE